MYQTESVGLNILNIEKSYRIEIYFFYIKEAIIYES